MNSKQAVASKPVKALLGTKLGMTQLWDEDGRLLPITVVRVGTNVVTQVRTPEVDGYSAVQLASGDEKTKNVTKPLQGHFAKAGVTPRKKLAEIRTPDASEYTLGQELTADIFEAGQSVDVIGTSRGKGFAGVMKRHGFAGVSASHVRTATTASPVPSAPAPPPRASSRVCAWLVAWVRTASRCRICPSTPLTSRTACCSWLAPSPVQRVARLWSARP